MNTKAPDLDPITGAAEADPGEVVEGGSIGAGRSAASDEDVMPERMGEGVDDGFGEVRHGQVQVVSRLAAWKP